MEVVAGKRYTPQDALRAGLVDELVEDSEDVEKEQAQVQAGRKAPPPQKLVQRAVALGSEHAPKVASGAWGGIKVSGEPMPWTVFITDTHSGGHVSPRQRYRPRRPEGARAS